MTRKKNESSRYRTQNPRFKLQMAGGRVNHCTSESNVIQTINQCIVTVYRAAYAI